mmetsp:Transcript_654/g.1539  ORF Transcript_654/g.1539 Transcript_654/m.1539 type:complete len:80 (+) Transcript_654:746-985(+)
MEKLTKRHSAMGMNPCLLTINPIKEIQMLVLLLELSMIQNQYGKRSRKSTPKLMKLWYDDTVVKIDATIFHEVCWSYYI